MRQFRGILRMYLCQLCSAFCKGSQGTSLIVGLFVLMALPGASLAAWLSTLLAGAGFVPDQAGMGQFMVQFVYCHSITLLLFCPFIFYSRRQLEEMAGVSIMPVSGRVLAFIKFLDVLHSFMLLFFALFLPGLWLWFWRCRGLGEIVTWFFFVLVLVSLLLIVQCLVMIYSSVPAALCRFLLRRRPRIALLVVAWHIFAIAAILATVDAFPAEGAVLSSRLQRLGSALVTLATHRGPLSAAVFGLALFVGAVLLVLFTLSAVGRLYADNILVIRNRLGSVKMPRKRKPASWFVLPAIPRAVQAVCRKDLRLMVCGWEFWLYLCLIILGLGVPGMTFSMISESGLDWWSAHAKFGFNIFLLLFLYVGLWQFKYEETAARNLVFYPVSCTHIVFGKSLAIFVLTIPFMLGYLGADRAWIADGMTFFKLLFIVAYVLFGGMLAVVIGGATANPAAKDLFNSVTFTGRILFYVLIVMLQFAFWAVVLLGTFMPAVFIVASLGLLLLMSLLATHSHLLIKGLYPGSAHCRAVKRLRTTPAPENNPPAVIVPAPVFGATNTAPRPKFFTAAAEVPLHADAVRRTLWLNVGAGFILAFPLFLAYLLVLGSLYCLGDYPWVFMGGLMIFPVLLGVLIAWPRPHWLVRLGLFAVLVSVGIILVVHRFPPVNEYASNSLLEKLAMHPVKLHNFGLMHILRMNSEAISAADNHPSEDRLLGAEIAERYGYEPDITLGELWAAQEPPKGEQAAQFLGDLGQAGLLYGARFKGDMYMWRAWLLRGVAEDDIVPLIEKRFSRGWTANAVWMLDAMIAAKLEGLPPPLCQAALELLYAACGNRWESYRTARLIEKLDLSVIGAEGQREILQWLTAPPPETGADLSARPRSGRTAFPAPISFRYYWEKATEKLPVFLIRQITSTSHPKLMVLGKLDIPEAFDSLQAEMLALLPEPRRTLMPPDNELILSGDSVNSETLFGMRNSFPAYATLVACYHPAVRPPGRFLPLLPAAADTDLPGVRLAVAALNHRNHADESIAFFRHLGWERISEWREDFGAASDELINLIARAVGNDPEMLAGMLSARDLPDKMEVAILENMMSSIKSGADVQGLWAVLSAHPHLLKKIGDLWRSFLGQLPHEQEFEVLTTLMNAGVPLQHCLKFNYRASNPQYPYAEREHLRKLVDLVRESDYPPQASADTVLAFYHMLEYREWPDLAIKWLAAFSNQSPAVRCVHALREGAGITRREILHQARQDPDKWPSEWLCEALAQSHRNQGNESMATLFAVHRLTYQFVDKQLVIKSVNLGVIFRALAFAPAMLCLVFWATISGCSFLPGFQRREQKTKRPAPAAAPTLPQALLLVLGVWAIQLPFGLALMQRGADFAAPLVVGALNIGSFAVVLFVGMKIAKTNLREICPLRAFPPLLLPGLLVLLPGLGIVASEADNILRTWLPMPSATAEFIARLTGHGLVSWIVLGLCAPLTEEPLFRGLILRGFRPNYGTRKAIVLSALVFAVAHLNPYQFFAAFAAGLLFAWMLIATGSLWPCLIAHALYNSQGFILTYVFGLSIPGYNTTDFEQVQFQPWWFNLLGLGLLAAGVCMVKRVLGPNHAAAPAPPFPHEPEMPSAGVVHAAPGREDKLKFERKL